MADKEIRIKTALDNSGFDKSIKELENKLKKMTQQGSGLQSAQSQLGKNSLMGKYAQSAFGDFSQQSQQKLKTMFQTQQREAMNQNITLKGKQSELDKIKRIEGEITKEQKDRVKLLEREMELLKSKHSQTIETASKIKALMPDTTSGQDGGKDGGKAGFLSKISSVANMLKGVALGAAIRGTFNAATTAYEEFGVSRSRKIEQAKGTALQGASREMREAASGTASDQLVYAPERAKAFKMAKEERDGRSNLDLAKGMWGTATGGVAGAVTGFAAGSLFPGIGNIVGGVAGFVGGGYLGAGERGRSRILDSERYKSTSMAEMMQNREGIEASLIAQDPSKKIGRDFFSKNLNRNVNFQRQTGIRDDNDMFGEGGLLQNQMDTGQNLGGRTLTSSEIMKQSNTIMGAGGGTSGAQLSGFAGSLNRQFGINNAGSTMGRLMGQGGLDTGGTEDAQKRLITEAIRLGVDASKMPQEMQRMIAVTSQISTQGGGFSEMAAQRVGSGITGLSAGQIQAAGSAFQSYQKNAKESGGFEGQQGFSFMLGDKGKKAFGKKAVDIIRKDHKLMNTLNQFSAEDLQKSPALLNGLARKLGISPEELLEGMDELNQFKQTRTVEEERLANEMKSLTKGKSAKEIDSLKTGKSKDAMRFQDLTAEITQERVSTRGKEFSGKGAFVRSAEIGMISGGGGADSEGAEQSYLQQLTKKILGAGEAELGSKGRQDLFKLEALNKHIKDFEKAAEETSKTSFEFNVIFEGVNKALKENGNKMTKEIEKIAKKLETMANSIDKTTNDPTDTKPIN